MDPLAEKSPDWSPYRYGFDNPVKYSDPTGMFEYSDGYSTQDSKNSTGSISFIGTYESAQFQTDLIVFSNGETGEVYNSYIETYNVGTGKVVGSRSLVNNPVMGNSGDLLFGRESGSFYGDALTFADKHFNGGLGTVSVAAQGYNTIGNDIKRSYAYKFSKMTGVKSGKIFQGAKTLAKGAGKLVSKLGPLGTVLGGGVITYEVMSGTWDAHTVVNTSLMIGAGAAAVFSAPAVLTGVAIYGVGDYLFDFGSIIDKNIGRNSGVWKP